MRVEDYLNAGMPKLPDHVASMFKDVRDQAASHTGRNGKERILAKARPSRPDSLRKYVIDNVRLITVGEYRKFLLKTSRLLKSNDLQLTMPDALIKWSDSSNFVTGHQKTDIWTWVYNVLLPAFLKDPNGYVIPFPYWNDDIPPYRNVPDGGIPKNESPKIDIRIIGSNKIRYVGTGILVWEFGYEVLNKGKHPTYMCCDVDGFTLLRPSIRDNKIEYYGEAWYDTTMFIPVQLPGHLDENHKESYLHSMFEYFDEFDSTFADNQAVRVQHAYPKVVMDSIPCKAVGCTHGQVKVKNELKPCSECRGTGYIQNPDVYSVLTRPALMPGEQGNNRPPIEYIFPPTESLNITYEVAFDLLSKGKKTVGIDTLVDSSESGTAKRHRLEDYDDMMQALAHGLMTCAKGVLESVGHLLMIEGDVTYTVPTTFNLQTISELQEEFNTSLPSIRESVYMAMVESRTHGNTEEMEVHKMALQASPLLIMTDDEIRMRLAANIYKEFDIWLKDNVLRIARTAKDADDVVRIGREEYERLNRT